MLTHCACVVQVLTRHADGLHTGAAPAVPARSPDDVIHLPLAPPTLTHHSAKLSQHSDPPDTHAQSGMLVYAQQQGDDDVIPSASACIASPAHEESAPGRYAHDEAAPGRYAHDESAAGRYAVTQHESADLDELNMIGRLGGGSSSLGAPPGQLQVHPQPEIPP